MSYTGQSRQKTEWVKKLTKTHGAWLLTFTAGTYSICDYFSNGQNCLHLNTVATLGCTQNKVHTTDPNSLLTEALGQYGVNGCFNSSIRGKANVRHLLQFVSWSTKFESLSHSAWSHTRATFVTSLLWGNCVPILVSTWGFMLPSTGRHHGDLYVKTALYYF